MQEDQARHLHFTSAGLTPSGGSLKCKRRSFQSVDCVQSFIMEQNLSQFGLVDIAEMIRVRKEQILGGFQYFDSKLCTDTWPICPLRLSKNLNSPFPYSR